MDKIDKAYDALQEKCKRHNERYDEFKNGFLSESFSQIVKDQIENVGNIIVSYDGYNFTIYPDYIRFAKGRIHGEDSFYENIGYSKGYADWCIRYMNSTAHKLNQRTAALDVLESHAEDIVRKITEAYKIHNEACDKELDSLMEMLDMPEEKSKHIKVTVEWV